jgi:CheY-like chemotaxis protein
VGIGLSILKTIVEEMSGSIKLETEVDRGSTFSISLPSISNIEEQSLSISKDFDTKKTKAKIEKYSLQGSALVVDDEKGIRDLLVDYLKDMGLKVDAADDGDTALEKIILRKYVYVCTDMTMPRMSGDVFIREAKKLPFGDTKYFVITGGITTNYSQETEEEIKVIVDSYIYKPFSHTTIYEALSGKVKSKII